ncbi:MAG TPA: hypothetical protein ACFYD6_04955 [Candidatus Brocadiia bacterium]|nr:hypothetical protein [Candidatus Brocadiales bacterium]
MNVLITGQHGVKHEDVADALVKQVNEIYGKRGLVGEPIIAHESIERAIKVRVGDDLPVFFRLPTDFERQKIWDDVSNVIKLRFEKTHPRPPVHKIISLHAIYYWEGRFFSLINWELLLSLSPTVIVTLIDDIYDIYGRIKQDQKNGVIGIPGGEYSLPVILSWREREILQTFTISKHLYLDPEYYSDAKTSNLPAGLRHVFHPPIKHFVISVKQSIQTLYDILFNRKKLPVYASFPISAPRRKLKSGVLEDKKTAEKIIEDLHNWRSMLHSKFAVFDPIGIDELRFGEDYRLIPRINFSVSSPMVSPIDDADSKIRPEELKAVKEQINYQIKERDFQLISQSQCTVMWRPLLWNEAHDGVQQEATYAKAAHKMIFSYHPSLDNMSQKPFPYEIGSFMRSEKDVVEQLERYQKNNWVDKINSDTWEREQI